MNKLREGVNGKTIREKENKEYDKVKGKEISIEEKR